MPHMLTHKKQFRTIDQYIKTFPKDVQSILEKLRQTIRKAAPEAVEAISYRMPTFKLNGKYLVYFAAWKRHIGFYPMPSDTKAFQKDLSPYKGAKGSVRFPIEKPIPYDLVRNCYVSHEGKFSKREIKPMLHPDCNCVRYC